MSRILSLIVWYETKRGCYCIHLKMSADQGNNSMDSFFNKHKVVLSKSKSHSVSHCKPQDENTSQLLKDGKNIWIIFLVWN